MIEVTSWDQVESAIKSKGFDPSKAKIHDHRRDPLSAKRDEASHELPSSSRRGSPASPKSHRDKALGRTDYLMKDKSFLSSNKSEPLRMETSYDLMSREIWRMTQQGENPFDTTR